MGNTMTHTFYNKMAHTFLQYSDTYAFIGPPNHIKITTGLYHRVISNPCPEKLFRPLSSEIVTSKYALDSNENNISSSCSRSSSNDIAASHVIQ